MTFVEVRIAEARSLQPEGAASRPIRKTVTGRQPSMWISWSSHRSFPAPTSPKNGHTGNLIRVEPCSRLTLEDSVGDAHSARKGVVGPRAAHRPGDSVRGEYQDERGRLFTSCPDMEPAPPKERQGRVDDPSCTLIGGNGTPGEPTGP